MNYRYIVVEGSIGSGKSGLSRKLAAALGFELMSEAPENNPFLMSFYLNASNHGLATQLAFLTSRAEAAKQITEEDERNLNIVSDFLLEKDQIFAPIVLEEKEETLYWQIKQKVLPEYPVPDLVIYLQSSDEMLNKNLQARKVDMLKVFPAGYLQEVHDEYHRFFHLYQHAPLLIVNADELDLIDNDEHFELLLHAMKNMQGSRHYLNLAIDD